MGLVEKMPVDLDSVFTLKSTEIDPHIPGRGIVVIVEMAEQECAAMDTCGCAAIDMVTADRFGFPARRVENVEHFEGIKAFQDVADKILCALSQVVSMKHLLIRNLMKP